MLGTSAAKALRRCCGNGPFPAAPSILDFDHRSKASAVRLASRLDSSNAKAVAAVPLAALPRSASQCIATTSDPTAEPQGS
jgi:hypothetical protein